MNIGFCIYSADTSNGEDYENEWVSPVYETEQEAKTLLSQKMNWLKSGYKVEKFDCHYLVHYADFKREFYIRKVVLSDYFILR